MLAHIAHHLDLFVGEYCVLVIFTYTAANRDSLHGLFIRIKPQVVIFCAQIFTCMLRPDIEPDIEKSLNVLL